MWLLVKVNIFSIFKKFLEGAIYLLLISSLRSGQHDPYPQSIAGLQTFG